MLTHHVNYFASTFAEIMGNTIDMKKLCARVDGHCDLAANFQVAKKKKSGATDSTDTASAQNDF